MELLFGGLVCLVAAFVVAGMGMLVVDPGGSVRRIRGASQAVPPKLLGATGPAFEPLQLAEPPLRWPSQSPWPKTRLPRQPWPSETWPGDFFGRKGGAFQAPKSRADEGGDWPDRPPAPEPKPAARQKPESKAKKQQQRAPEPVRSAPAAPREPSPDEVIAWVQQLGLAGAVEKVRERTGWDFQAAAQFLATTLRQHREGV